MGIPPQGRARGARQDIGTAWPFVRGGVPEAALYVARASTLPAEPGLKRVSRRTAAGAAAA